MQIKKLILAFMPAVFLVGCGVGDAPAGMSADDAKSAIDRMPPDQKIRAIASSPMPSQEKEKRYKEIEAQTGVKAADVLGGGGNGMPGAGRGG